MKTKTWIGWVQLHIECRGLDSLLFVASEFSEAIGEGIRYSEVHGVYSACCAITCRNTVSISGPGALYGATFFPSGHCSAIVGGSFSFIETPNAFIGGAAESSITGNGYGAAICGGDNNAIDGPFSFIGGGYANTNHGSWSVIVGGYGNDIYTNSLDGVIIGGRQNSITNGTTAATVLGGEDNSAGASYTLVSGRNAHANHQGAFVWSDSQTASYSSATTNIIQFRAQNGLKLDGGPFKGSGVLLTNQVTSPAPVGNSVILWYSNNCLWATGPNKTNLISSGL